MTSTTSGKHNKSIALNSSGIEEYGKATNCTSISLLDVAFNLSLQILIEFSGKRRHRQNDCASNVPAVQDSNLSHQYMPVDSSEITHSCNGFHSIDISRNTVIIQASNNMRET